MKNSSILQVSPLGFPWATQDPFLFCVYHEDQYPEGNSELGPRASLTGRSLGQDFNPVSDWRMYHGQKVPGFPAHPHRGFETVTVVNKGVVDHADSLGASARYGHGDTQWLTAGKGIQHSEMFPLLKEDSSNPLELFQIWLNLPADSKMVPPDFRVFWKDEIPDLEFDGGRVRVRVIAGVCDTAVAPTPPPDSWASKQDSEVAIWTIDMEPNSSWTIPSAKEGVNRTLYYYQGSGLLLNGQEIPMNHSAELVAENAISITNGNSAARMLFLQGRPIGEEVAQHGPFVMNTREELQQAFVDYRKTQFGGWQWKSSAPVHGKRPRFATYADGRKEER